MAIARPGADYNIKILRPLAIYVTEKKGTEAFARVTASAGLEPSLFDGRTLWISTKQFETLLRTARDLLVSDEEFRNACSYKIAESYGPMRFVLRAASASSVIRASVTTYRLVSNVGDHEIISHSRTSMTMIWRAKPAPDRLVCLCKQAQVSSLTTMWGLPAARLVETSCLARGDDTCAYEINLFDSPRWLPTIGLAAFGAFAGWALHANHYADTLSMTLLPLLLGFMSYTRESRSTEDANRVSEQQMTEALGKLVDQEAAARQELWELHRSQTEWSRLLEHESRDRAEALQNAMEHFQQIEQSRSEVFRGYSHDLRNPLQVMRLGTGFLKAAPLGTDPKMKTVLDEIDWSVEQMSNLLTELNKVIQQPTGTGQLVPKSLSVNELTEKLRRRLRALAYGKDVNATVFSTREAPSRIMIDPVLFDRVLDNLMTNAIKYTERGSIIVELDGSPGLLVVKISDTGRGIAAEELQRTFTPGGSDSHRRAAHSLGVGLSVVVQLLAQVDGHLEVMSKPSQGTTFWVKLPVEAARPKVAAEPFDRAFERVVSIRRVS